MASTTRLPQAEAMIADLESNRFFGSLEIRFEAGRVVLLRKIETIKPTDCRNNRGEYGRTQEDKPTKAHNQ